MRFMFPLTIALLLLAAPRSEAFFFGRKKAPPASSAAETNVMRRYHLRIPGKAAEQEMLRLFAQKKRITMQIVVLSGLADEKMREAVEVGKKLEQEFAMAGAAEYEYDQDQRVVYVKVDGGRKEHLKLASDEQVARFKTLIGGRQLLNDERRVFALVVGEKQGELRQVDQVLRDKFSVSSDRAYQYEPETMRLYEMVIPPKDEDAFLPETLFQTPVPVR